MASRLVYSSRPAPPRRLAAAFSAVNALFRSTGKYVRFIVDEANHFIEKQSWLIMIYYYDFSKERQIGNWQVSGGTDGKVNLDCCFEADEAGKFVLLWDECRGHGYPEDPRILSVNGRDAGDFPPFYIRRGGSRRGMPLDIRKGRNHVRAEIEPGECRLEEFHMSLIPAPEKRIPAQYSEIWTAPAPECWEETEPLLHENWVPGLGRETMPGRFGLNKGDGLLDCAMTSFGIVTKMHICGDPRYLRPYIWTYSLEQEDDTAEKDTEKIDVNQLSVHWRRGNTSYAYSLASSGIVTERKNGREVKLSRLEFAGDYRYVMTAEEIASPEDFSGKMPESWLLLFGAADYPEVPLLVVLEEKPEKITFHRLPDGRLDQVVFHGCRKMTTATPFGFTMMEPKTPRDRRFLQDAARRCRFWARAFLAFPIACREYFRLDHDARKVQIIQDFEYRLSQDAWHTEPLRLAPLPPMLAIDRQKLPAGARDFRFPTKYGDLFGFAGTSSAYAVDMIRPKRKFPLRNTESGIPDLLKDGLDDYFDFEEKFPDTIQSYAYPGAILEAYAYGVSMAFFMPPDRRELLARKLAERLELACDPDRRYTLLLTDHALLAKTEPGPEEVYRYYADPALGRLEMFNIYERREPYTGQKYNLCYFNVGLMWGGEITSGTREEVMEYPYPFVENDWGIGLTFYMLYSAALFSGNWEPIRKNWDALKKMYRYFDIFQDWACMGAGYAEKSRTWIEGANFGAFTAFLNIAEILGDQKAAEYADYLAAKMLTLCRGRFLAGPYFARCYGRKTWYGNRFFQEEVQSDHPFQYVPTPEMLKIDRVIPLGVSLLTTDAIYPELFESFRETAPEKHRKMMDRYREALRAGLAINNVEFSYQLVNDALDPRVPEKEVLENIRLAKETGKFITCWHDIHRFENYLPPHYLEAQLMAWLEMRSQPIWLEEWRGMRIRSAEWHEAEKKASVEIIAAGPGPRRLLCGVRRKISSSVFTGGTVIVSPGRDNTVLFECHGSGMLNIFF